MSIMPFIAGKRKRVITYGKRQTQRQLQSQFHSDVVMGSWLPSSDNIDHSQTPPDLPPKKPTSQKAATMPAEPDEGAVQSVSEVTGMLRSEAIRYLKVSYRSVRTIQGRRVLRFD